MKYRVLNFPDAMKLAQILSPHLDTVSIKEMTGKEFGYFVFSTLSDDEVISMIQLLGIYKPESLSADELMFSCTEALIKNNLLDLLSTYEQLGVK